MDLKSKIIITDSADRVDFRKFDKKYLCSSYGGRGGLNLFCEAVERQFSQVVRWEKGEGKSKKIFLLNVAPNENHNELYEEFYEKYAVAIDPDGQGLHDQFLDIFLIIVFTDDNFEDDEERKSFLSGFSLGGAFANKAQVMSKYDQIKEDLNDTAADPRMKSLKAVIYYYYLRPILVEPMPKPDSRRKAQSVVWQMQTYVKQNINKTFK